MVELERIGHKYAFHLPITKLGYYKKIVFTNVLRHANRLDRNKTSLCGLGRISVINIADEIVRRLFAHSNSEYTANYVTDKSEWMFLVNIDTCLYTPESMTAACQILTNMINNKEDFHSLTDSDSQIVIPYRMLEVLELSK